MQLLINAVKHNQGDIAITFTATQEKQRLKIQVIDDGNGIGKNQVAAIFNRSSRFSEHSTGLGLGLSIVKSLVELHTGEICVNSKPGNTCFTLYFPATAVPEQLHFSIKSIII